jgi:hypothetical protein
VAYEQLPASKRAKKVSAGDVLKVKLPIGRDAADQRHQIAQYEALGWERTGKVEDGAVELAIEKGLHEQRKAGARKEAKTRMARLERQNIPGQTEDFVSVGNRRYNAGGVMDRDTVQSLIREEMRERLGAGEDLPDHDTMKALIREVIAEQNSGAAGGDPADEQ